MSELRSQYAADLFNFGKALRQQGKYEKAMENLQLSDVVEHNMYTYYEMYLCCKALGEEDDALECIELCCEQCDENYSFFGLAYAKELVSRGDKDKAKEVLQLILDEFEESDEVRQYLGEIN